MGRGVHNAWPWRNVCVRAYVRVCVCACVRVGIPSIFFRPQSAPFVVLLYSMRVSPGLFTHTERKKGQRIIQELFFFQFIFSFHVFFRGGTFSLLAFKFFAKRRVKKGFFWGGPFFLLFISISTSTGPSPLLKTAFYLVSSSNLCHTEGLLSSHWAPQNHYLLLRY